MKFLEDSVQFSSVCVVQFDLQLTASEARTQFQLLFCVTYRPCSHPTANHFAKWLAAIYFSKAKA